MKEFFSSPLAYILIVNIFTLIWGIRSWKKNIREKWMGNLRDAGAELIGVSELLYAESMANDSAKVSPLAKSSFIAKEQKLLLLFAHNHKEKDQLKNLCEELRSAAENAATTKYRNRLNDFSNLISERLLKEWKDIK